MDYAISLAVPNDFSRINELFIQMLQSIYQKEDVSGLAPNDLDSYFEKNDDRIYVIKEGGKIIAFLSIERHDDEGGYLYLDDFCVDRAYRGQGIGTVLLKQAEDYAHELGISAIVLHVESVNTRAYSLYKRFGYKDLEIQGHRILMCKKLA